MTPTQATRMPAIQCNGVELHVERLGSGPRLLFCNGSGTTVATSRGLLNRGARSFELLCFDYRGMGASAPISQPYAMADIAADPKVYGTDQPLIDETFMAADPLIRAAVPDPPLFDLAQRVDRIFVEGSGPPPADGGADGGGEPDGQEVVLPVALR